MALLPQIDTISGVISADIVQDAGKTLLVMNGQKMDCFEYRPFEGASTVWVVNIQGMWYRVSPTNTVTVNAEASTTQFTENSNSGPHLPPSPTFGDSHHVHNGTSQLEAEKERLMLLLKAQREEIEKLKKEEELLFAASVPHTHTWIEVNDTEKVPGPHKGRWGGAINGHHCCGLCKLNVRRLSLQNIGRCTGQCNSVCPNNIIEVPVQKLVCSCGEVRK